MTVSSLLFLTLLFQDDAPAQTGSPVMLRVVAALGALVLVGIVIWRRKRTAKKEEDDEF
jgi:MYXO-CTERM domain-containing protein